MTSNQVGASYQWIDCNTNTLIPGAVGQSYTVNADGSYAVIVTLNSSFDTSNCETFVNVGLKGLNKLNENWTFFPNPAKNTLTISSGVNLQNRYGYIYSISGTMVKEFRIETKNQLMDISTLENGIYLIRFAGKTEKLILLE